MFLSDFLFGSSIGKNQAHKFKGTVAVRAQLRNQVEVNKMSKSSLLFALVFIFWPHIKADIFEECSDADAESFVSSYESCQAYVYCDGDDSILGQCDDGQYFDPESGTCDDAANVSCFLDEVEEPPVEEEPEEPAVQPTQEPEPTPPTMDTPAQVDVVNVAPIVKPSCPQSDDPSQVIFMANNESCTDYYLCYHGHAMQMQCTNQLHFNPTTGQCDYPENVHCAVGLSRETQLLSCVNYYYFALAAG